MWGRPPSQDAWLPEGCEITTDRSRYREARAVVFHIPAWRWKPRFLFPKKLAGQLWVALSMECEENYPRLKDTRFMSAFDLTMTYRLDSDVPSPYLPLGGETRSPEELRQPPQAKTAAAPVASFISSRVNRSGRLDYVREFSKYIAVDSYGKFLKNAALAKDTGRSSKLDCISRYKFTLGFENAIARDYVTEKFFDPLLAGSVPVYFGAPNVEQFAPGDHCYINAADFADPKALADRLTELAQDDGAYNKFLEWRQKPLRPSFLALTTRFALPVRVRLCHAIQRRLEAR